jgi:hypothetical protein
MILRAYFDEHGHNGSAVYAIAGYAGTDEQWTAFTEKWCTTLACHYAFGPFHMVDFENSEIDKHSQFYGWTKEQKTELAIELFRLIPDSGVRGVVSAIIVRGFRRLPSRAQKELGDPYWTCFHNCIEQLLDQIPDGERADLGFDKKRGYVDEALDRYKFLTECWLAPAKAAKLIGGLIPLRLIIRLKRMLLNSLRVGQASLPAAMCEGERSHHLYLNIKCKRIDPLQNDGGGASKKTRAARQAGPPVLLI